MKKIIMITLIMTVGLSFGSILPGKEEVIIRNVARQYGFCSYKTAMLLAIRRSENGGPGLEFGIGDGIPNHPARRYAGNFNKSLRLQADWAAGTIQKRYMGNLQKFARRYCIVNWRAWNKNVRYYISVQLVSSKPDDNVSDGDGYEDADTINNRTGKPE